MVVLHLHLHLLGPILRVTGHRVVPLKQQADCLAVEPKEEGVSFLKPSCPSASGRRKILFCFRPDRGLVLKSGAGQVYKHRSILFRSFLCLVKLLWAVLGWAAHLVSGLEGAGSEVIWPCLRAPGTAPMWEEEKISVWSHRLVCGKKYF